MQDFFKFRMMVSTIIIEIFYIIGFLVLTIGGIVFLFQGKQGILIGLGAIIIGNLVWRVLCESWIVLFSIHDILDSIDKTFKEKNL